MRPVSPAVVAAAVFTAAMALGAQVPPPQGGRAGGPGRGGDSQAAPATGTGVIVGTVVDGVTGRPVPGAIVMLAAPGAQRQQASYVMVGADGRFVFRDVPAGTYPLQVTKNGYLDSGAGRTSPTGPMRPMELRDGDRVGDAVLRMWRHSVISGAVIDERGEPAVGMKVTLLQRAVVNGQWGLHESDSTRTDDRGAYRFAKITPGRYVVAAEQDLESFAESAMIAMAADLPAIMTVVAGTLAGGRQLPDIDFRARIIPPFFAPGVRTEDEALTITVASGDERSGVTIRAARVPTYRVAGTIGGPDPMPANLNVQLVNPAHSNREAGVNIAGGRGGGRFEILAVPPGQYELRAIAVPPQGGRGRGFGPRGGVGPGAQQGPPPAPETPTWWAVQRITIADRDADDLAIVLQQGVRISGRLQFEGTSPPPAAERFIVSAASVDSGVGARINVQGAVHADGSFRTTGLAPGRYALRLNAAAAPWRLKAVRAAGRDVTDLPFEVEGDEIADVVIALTDQPPSTISGSVRQTRSGSASAVFVFPADRQAWSYLEAARLRVKAVSVGKDGRYSVSGLPEGDYYVFAGPEDRVLDWQQPDVLEQFAALAVRVQLRDAEQRTLDLTRGDR